MESNLELTLPFVSTDIGTATAVGGRLSDKSKYVLLVLVGLADTPVMQVILRKETKQDENELAYCLQTFLNT
jgi:hypothetical protein